MSAPWSWFTRTEKRAEDVAVSDPALAGFLGQRGSVASVSTARASGLAVAQACVSVICQNLAAMPLNLYSKDEEGGRSKADRNPLYSVLHDQFNPNMTAFEGRELLISSLLTNGNAYARIETNMQGQIIALLPLNPATVTVERLESGRLRYRHTDGRGRGFVYLQDEVLHLRYRLGSDGIMGLSPIQLARDTFDLAASQSDQAKKQAKKSFRLEGAVVFPNAVNSVGKDDAMDKLGKRIEANSETSGVLVLDAGADFKAFSTSSRDAEFLESRKLSNMDIARVFNVPPTVVGITDNATYSNVDGESKALVVRCLAPMAKRIEQALNAALLSRDARRTLFIEHDLAGLLRGDQKARFEAYRIGREWGWMSANEIRQLENMSKIDGGEEYLTPLNMTATRNEGGDDV
jgi:HK97 family phage portal protein